jgi:hypothetical protein
MFFRSLTALLLWVSIAPTVPADFREDFESGETSWRLADADCGIRVTLHRRDDQTSHAGRASEHLQIVTGQGSFAHFVHTVPQARVIAEWSPTLWVKSDRSGHQLMARVVLPRTVDPNTGQPMTALLRGDAYERAGMWQQLRIQDADQSLNREVRILRSHFGPDVDAHEAFVDLIVLNAYGGLGTANIWIDDLQITGQVGAVRFSSHAYSDTGRQGEVPGAPAGAVGPDEGSAYVNGSVTVAGGRPLFPRVIEYNGEPFETLQSLGFNAIRLAAPPTDVQLREAARLNMWLVAPPPNDRLITPSHDRVLAWHLGRRLAAERLELTRQWISELRRADLRRDRPIVGEPIERIWSYSRVLDLLELDRSPLGSSLSLQQYGRWLEERPVLARPGTPFWATIQTEPTTELVDQWAAIGLGTPVSVAAEAAQIRLLGLAAVSSGARGLVFRSRTPLDSQDNDAQTRARALQRLNIDLELIEPWVAGGTRATDVSSPELDIRIGMLQTERSQLLIITDRSPQQQITAGTSSGGPSSLIIPSAATAPQVYALKSGGLRTLSHRRVAGGIRIQIEDRGRINLIAITQDPLVLSHLARTLAQHTAASAKLHYELASGELELAELVHARLLGQTSSGGATDQLLAQARDYLRHCEVLLGGSDYAAAADYSEKSMICVGRLRQSHWEDAVRDFPSPVSSPFCVNFSAILLHWEMARRLQASPAWSPNQLPAGDFESLDHLRASGWKNVSQSPGSVQGFVELSPQSPHGGRANLRLLAAANNPQDEPAALEVPPVQIVSPPIRVRSGQLVRIHGWIRVPQPIKGSQDGLLIYDSLAGAQLADRIAVADAWREFVLYRAATVDGDVSITFALTGIGEAHVDDVTISIHGSIADRYAGSPLDEARRLPPATDMLRW